MTTAARRCFRTLALVGLLLGGPLVAPGRGDTVLLRDGMILRGTVDKDNAIVFVSDNLKRTVLYSSKVSRTDPDNSFGNLERFQLVQPLEVHGGVMPGAAVDIVAGTWDAKGRRSFQYRNTRKVAMQQAINEISPHLVGYRGIDGFWKGQVATSEVPRPVILGLLAKVEQSNENERLRVARFLIQAQWFAEARTALDDLQRDFPSLKERIAEVRRSVAESAARDALIAADRARRAQQPAEARRILRSINDPTLPREVRDEVQNSLRQADDRDVADRALADRVRELLEQLSEAERAAWRGRVAEVLLGIAQVPDVARLRLEPAFRAAEGTDPPPVPIPPETRFARALGAWVAGPDAPVETLAAADHLWQARLLARNYLSGRAEAPRPDPSSRDRDRDKEKDKEKDKAREKATPPPPDDPAKVRREAIDGLNALQAASTLSAATLEAIALRLVPPLDEPRDDEDRSVTMHRVADDENPTPTEYAVLLPPEYHPLRSYPVVVALHDGSGPRAAVDWVAAEASRRGYIVIAPEYNTPGRGHGYRYSAEEHAAVQLSLRDARKRYAIDSDRVFLAGQLTGADMAWDLGLAHPDLFAGVVAVSGFPAKYSYKYRAQVDRVPLYVVLGALAPAAREVVFDKFVRPMIEDFRDVIYVDYLNRGLEALPEEVPSFFDWMSGRRRDPAPKVFDVATARPTDARFYGVIVQEIVPGRSTTPEAADPLGGNIRPATLKFKASGTGNLLNLTASGINRLDVWISPKLIDFSRKAEIRLNNQTLYKGILKPDLALMLEDLRVRGDRQQIYQAKVSTAASKARGR